MQFFSFEFKRKEEENREDRLDRLAGELAAMTDEEVRKFVKRAKPGMHLAINPKRNGKDLSNRDKEAEHGFEDYDRRRDDEAIAKG